ncbi:MAG: hypothetical protein OJF61_001169 [Rhodanobacteraceae bacterium]|jgi:hypothetical protein|nr:MAG: hypothetical protein OJF61_001169 [Rhodanobacteraceae bacterium]
MAEMEKPFGHEPDAIDYRTILISAGILAAAVIGVVLGLHAVLTGAVMPNYAEVAARPGQVPPEPRLQPHPQADLAKFRAQKEALLSGYAWTDAQHDYARIPIERAMQIYVQKHARAKTAPASASSSAKAAVPGAQR